MLHGEARRDDLDVRPDFAVDVDGIRVGYVELKAPGYGVPTRWQRRDKRNDEQFKKLQALPLVLYSDGHLWALFRYGQRVGDVAELVGDLATAGRRLAPADKKFASLLTNFLSAPPERPRSLAEIVRVSAGLCDLLREEVAVGLSREARDRTCGTRLTDIAAEWRELLLPSLGNEDFAHAYAQTVTFALLLARAEGIDFDGASLDSIADRLSKKHLLMGKALETLVFDDDQSSVAIDTLVRVLAQVDWSELNDSKDDRYQLLYERFLQRYDPQLRKSSGSYYTPRPLVSFIVRFVNDLLMTRLDVHRGLTEDRVVVVDPAMGTGTFLAEIVQVVAEEVRREEDPLQVAPRLRSLAGRLIGFEKQVAPFAVAEFQLHETMRVHGVELPKEESRFLVDTLDDPSSEQLRLFGRMYKALQQNREGANRVKRDTPVFVVLGNPPYASRVRKSARRPWIEARGTAGSSRPGLDAFRAARNGLLEYVLSDLSIYFWRWATWKVFDAHPGQSHGVVAFVSPAGFTTGPGFAGMREYLRRTADEGWIIDLSPEGHRSTISSRVFPGVQNPLCIAIFVRHRNSTPDEPAAVRYTSIPGAREEKYRKLSTLALESEDWLTCSAGWQDQFRPSTSDFDWPRLSELMPWHAPGLKPNRTWVYAPDANSLRRRWEKLVGAHPDDKSLLFKESRDANLQRMARPLPNHPHPERPFSRENGKCPEPVRASPRSFDRQWTIPDARLHHAPSPSLWRVFGEQQIFVTEQHAHPVKNGPALTFTCGIPDMDHYNGRGGRVRPLYRDREAHVANIAPRLLTHMGNRLGCLITGEEFLAYVAAVTAHDGYIKAIGGVMTGGVRVPVTADLGIWRDAVEAGRKVVWLHTYGERFIDPARGRPHRIPRSLIRQKPNLVCGIPDGNEDYPTSYRYDKESQTLHLGKGALSPVPLHIYNYEVGGLKVIDKWLAYRVTRCRQGEVVKLDHIRAGGWSADMTRELLDLITIITAIVDLAPEQMRILATVLASPLITESDLHRAGLLPAPNWAALAPRSDDVGQLPLV